MIGDKFSHFEILFNSLDVQYVVVLSSLLAECMLFMRHLVYSPHPQLLFFFFKCVLIFFTEKGGGERRMAISGDSAELFFRHHQWVDSWIYFQGNFYA